MKLQMSLQRSVPGWRLLPVPCVGPELLNLDTGLLSQLQKLKKTWVETDPEMLSQQQVDDHIWENIGKPVRLFQEEWSDLFGSTHDNITAYVSFSQSKDTGLTATKKT